jgi:hypothetical protein
LDLPKNDEELLVEPGATGLDAVFDDDEETDDGKLRFIGEVGGDVLAASASVSRITLD